MPASNTDVYNTWEVYLYHTDISSTVSLACVAYNSSDEVIPHEETTGRIGTDSYSGGAPVKIEYNGDTYQVDTISGSAPYYSIYLDLQTKISGGGVV